MHVRLLAVGLLAAFAARAAHAQSTLLREAPLLAAPDGHAVASLARGAEVRTDAARGAMVAVHVEGWVSSALLAGARDSFEVSIAKPDVRLRAGPSTSAAVVALAERGMGLHVVRRAGQWTRVRRTGWVARAAVSTKQAAARTPPAPRPAASADQAPRSTGDRKAAAPGAGAGAVAQEKSVVAPAQGRPPASGDSAAASPEALTPARAVTLARAPDGSALATVQPGALLEPVGRDRGWVRVRVEGWIPEGELVAADSAVRSPSVADLRADAAHATGRLVRWTVEVLAFRTADALRPDLRRGEAYLLARTAGDENAVVYLAVPHQLEETARGIPPLSQAIVTARVRTARSDPTGVPILDIVALARL